MRWCAPFRRACVVARARPRQGACLKAQELPPLIRSGSSGCLPLRSHAPQGHVSKGRRHMQGLAGAQGPPCRRAGRRRQAAASYANSPLHSYADVALFRGVPTVVVDVSPGADPQVPAIELVLTDALVAAVRGLIAR